MNDGLRSGTENIAGIVGLAKAADLARRDHDHGSGTSDEASRPSGETRS